MKSEGRDIADLRPVLAKLKEAYSSGSLAEAGNLLEEARGILARIEGSEGEPAEKPEEEGQGRGYREKASKERRRALKWEAKESFHLGMAGLPYEKRWEIYTRDKSYTTRMLDTMKGFGIRWVTVRFNWEGIEPEPGKFDFSFYDWLVSQFEKRDMCLLGQLAFFWKQDLRGEGKVVKGGKLTDEQEEAYCRLIEETLGHFRGKAIAWQFAVGTEHVDPHSPREAADFLVKVYKAARNGDPDSFIVISPQAPSPRKEKKGVRTKNEKREAKGVGRKMQEKLRAWHSQLEAMWEAGVRPDALGLHSYPESAVEMASILKALGEYLDRFEGKHGVRPDLWGVEIGLGKWILPEHAARHGDLVREKGRNPEEFTDTREAQAIARLMFTLAGNGVKCAAFRRYLSLLEDKKRHESPRLSFRVFDPIGRALSGKYEVANGDIKVSLPGEKVTAYFLKKEDGSLILVLWNTDATPIGRRKPFDAFESTLVTVELPVESGRGRLTRIVNDESLLKTDDFRFEGARIETALDKEEVLIFKIVPASGGGDQPGARRGVNRKDFRWEAFRDRPKEWFGSEEAVRIADNVLSFQMEHGGWSKGIDMVSHARSEGERISVYHKDLGTFDNGQTTSQMRFLAAVHNAGGNERFKKGFMKGLEYVFKAQYPSGGFPQVFQLRGNYSNHVTFNDGAMQNVLALLKEVVECAEYGFAGEDTRKKAKASLDRGIDYILESQIEANGVPTGWCQQHDPVTFEPTPGRKHEPAALSAAETASIVLLLRSLEGKPPRVVRSIEAAVEWMKAVRLDGVEVSKTKDGLGVRTNIPGAHCWARFYEMMMSPVWNSLF